jgi:hypothetical protein
VPSNWLQVLGPAELARIDQRVCQQLHAIMPLLDTFKSEQQPFERIVPRKGALDAHPQHMDSFIEEAFAPALRSLAVAWVFFEALIGFQGLILTCVSESSTHLYVLEK